MRFNPDIHHRRSIRLRSHDYSKPACYFITLCVYNNELLFDDYPVLKDIVNKEWRNIPSRYRHVTLDEYVIMPNHLHGIIIVGATLAVAHTRNNKEITGAATKSVGAFEKRAGTFEKRAGTFEKRAGASPAPTLGSIIGSFKSISANTWFRYIKENDVNTIGKFWQRSYYDHIIRNEEERNSIREYI